MPARRSTLSALELIAELEKRDPSLSDLAKGIATDHRVTEEEMLEDDRRAMPTHARHALWAALVDDNAMTLTYVADLFGMHHTTILYGVRRIRAERLGEGATA